MAPFAARDWIEIGRVRRAHGLEGALLIALHGAEPDTLLGLDEIALVGDPGRIPFAVVSATDRGPGRDGRARVELRLRGLGSRDRAERFRGCAVAVPPGALPPLPEGEFYHRDLIGLRVRGVDGADLGEIEELRSTRGPDLLVVRSGRRRLLIPAVDEILVRIDPGAGEVVIDPPSGLLDAEEPA